MSKDALLEVGDVNLKKKRKKRKKIKTDVSGNVIGIEEVEEDVIDIDENKLEKQVEDVGQIDQEKQ